MAKVDAESPKAAPGCPVAAGLQPELHLFVRVFRSDDLIVLLVQDVGNTITLFCACLEVIETIILVKAVAKVL